MRSYVRPENARKESDEVEDEILVGKIAVEKEKKVNLDSIAGYKNHPEYVFLCFYTRTC